MKQPASHDAAPRRVHASSLETYGEVACRPGKWGLGGGALGNETDGGLKTAGMLLELDVLVVVDGDFMLRAEKACGGERRHRALGRHDETFATSGEPARETT
jgi:hypothetical protein